MCGVAGVVGFREASPDHLDGIGRILTACLAHRGPDAMEWWTDVPAGLVLAHTRLAVVDLSVAGAQPMISACGRWVIAYNGEIYNSREVARDLPGIGWRGHSDTEVLLEACAAWGVEKAVQRFIGMFAFALWDRIHRRLYLGRDRLGIKPLYYGSRDGVFAFASELKAMTGLFRLGAADIDQQAVDSYLQLSYVPAPLSIFRGVRKLLPGHILQVDETGQQDSCFWDIWQVAQSGLTKRQQLPEADVEASLHELLYDAVGRRMIADVPLGSLLSGGVDSSLVTALMQAQSGRPVKTFSIGFQEESYNEAGYAKAVAAHLGTDHTEMIVTSADAFSTVPELASIFDEPFADSSQIPTLLVSRLARQSVTVALSGDGGDEVFAGYTRYPQVAAQYRRLSHIPAPLRGFAAAAARKMLHSLPNVALAGFSGSPQYLRTRMSKALAFYGESSLEAAYQRSLQQWPSTHPDFFRETNGHFDARWDDISRMRYLDMRGYLPDDILVKLDRASMAVALEARVPLLDHRVVEAGWSLGGAMLTNGRQGKVILRSILERYVPAHLIERPKMGFGIPLDDWLRGPLRSWADDLLTVDSLRHGLFPASPVSAAWREHKAHRGNWGYRLWTVLMLQAWLRRWC
jgi:asparagine synthase (glutamine-hydrolysing)